MRQRINAHSGAEARRFVQPTGGAVHTEACLDMMAIARTSADAAADIKTLLSPASSRFTTLQSNAAQHPLIH
jgi:hypothetical protein